MSKISRGPVNPRPEQPGEGAQGTLEAARKTREEDREPQEGERDGRLSIIMRRSRKNLKYEVGKNIWNREQ